jgi:hypothetical protein
VLTWRVSKGVVGSCALALLTLSVQPTGDRDAFQQVAAQAVEAAKGSVRDFAHALASLHVPGGVVARRRDWRQPRRVVVPPGELGSSLGVLAAAFERRHPDYALKEEEGGVVVAPKGSICEARMSQERVTLAYAGPLNQAVHRLFREVVPSLPDFPPSIVGTGDLSVNEMLVFEAPVAVDLHNVTLVEGLNALSQQVPGFVWAVEEHTGVPGATTCTVEMVGKEATVQTSYRF